MASSLVHGFEGHMARRASARRAMTLFEIIAVTFIIGIVAAMAPRRRLTSRIPSKRLPKRLRSRRRFPIGSSSLRRPSVPRAP